MVISETATAGNAEKGDVLVTVGPNDHGLNLTISSTVMHQFGRQIREVALETLDRLGVENAQISLEDHGAWNFVLKARVECAVYRACHWEKPIPWGGAIR